MNSNQRRCPDLSAMNANGLTRAKEAKSNLAAISSSRAWSPRPCCSAMSPLVQDNNSTGTGWICASTQILRRNICNQSAGRDGSSKRAFHLLHEHKEERWREFPDETLLRTP